MRKRRAPEFSVTDRTDVEIARIGQTWEGVVKAVFGTADYYVVRIHRQLPDPLASLPVP